MSRPLKPIVVAIDMGYGHLRPAHAIAERLGVPVFPHSTLTFTGSVARVEHDGSEVVVHVELRGATEDGDHASGTAVLSVPA